MKDMTEIIAQAKEKMPSEKYSEFLNIIKTKATKGLIKESAEEIDKIIYLLERVDNNIDTEFLNLFIESEQAVKKYENFFNMEVSEDE